MKRTYAYRGGKLTEITQNRVQDIRHSDGQRIVQEGSLSDRVMLGFKDVEQRQGSSMFQKLPFSANHIKRVWAQ